MANNLVRIARALISVSDKTGLADLGRDLASRGVEILSTGGTAQALRTAGVPVVEVAAHTGFPEIMGGRVKTLHPTIHGGLLALRDDPAHQQAMADHGIPPIDLLVSNLYPFEATLARGEGYDACVENIDIGGPAMIRAAAKNHAAVSVIVDVEDYRVLIDELDANGGATAYGFRQRLAAIAYARTAAYDAAVSGWFAEQVGEAFPRRLTIAGERPVTMRYGENPHQRAAFYRTDDRRPGAGTARLLQGKDLSYNNLNDTDAAFELAAEFDEPAVAIIKHANPCGVAVAGNLAEAYAGALRCDPVSAYGGIVAVNRTLDGPTAEAIVKVFTEVVIAPDLDDDARAVFAARRNLRVLATGGMPDPAAPGRSYRPLAGGFLMQERDAGRVSAADLKVVSKRAPSDAEMRDLLIAFRIAKHVKSNAIVYVRGGASAGIGAGQMSRVDAARIAAIKAGEAAGAAGLADPLTRGSVAASDAFFPFADGLLTVAQAGATAVIQPGGSKRDDEVIAAADARGLAMVLTGMRHFRH
jgi:phosphoribosylaminoimidazolecarboxamide formyltransferase / IMP cyclohydrolase